MLKLQRLIGLPVIDTGTGKMAGKVKDVWFDEHWLLQGLLLEPGKWLPQKMKAIYWHDVLVCGEDAIMITGIEAIKPIAELDIQRSFHTGRVQLKDLPLITEAGLQLGRITDVYFQKIKGTPILGYELTDGFISDLLEGRKWYPAPEDISVVVLGDDAIIVPALSEQHLKHTATSESGV